MTSTIQPKSTRWFLVAVIVLIVAGIVAAASVSLWIMLHGYPMSQSQIEEVFTRVDLRQQWHPEGKWSVIRADKGLGDDGPRWLLLQASPKDISSLQESLKACLSLVAQWHLVETAAVDNLLLPSSNKPSWWNPQSLPDVHVLYTTGGKNYAGWWMAFSEKRGEAYICQW